MVMRRAMSGILPEEVQWRGAKSNMAQFRPRAASFERERLEEVILERSRRNRKVCRCSRPASGILPICLSSSKEGMCDLESRILGSVAATYGSETRKF